MMSVWNFGFRLLLFLATNGLVAFAAFTVTRRLARGFLTKTEILATAITIAAAQIVVTQIILGLIGILIWWPVMAANGLLAVGLLLTAARQHLKRPIRRDSGGEHPRDRIAWGVLLTVGVITLVNLRKVVGMPPFGADSLGYHLPMAVEWLQTGKILIKNPIPFAFYPGVSELVDLWLLLPFHDSLLVNLQNWPFALLTALTLYNLARRIGVPVRWAVYGSLLFIGIRSVQWALAFADFQDNDVLLTAFFLAAVNLSIVTVESENRALLICEGIALGLLIGTKYNGLGYALLAGVAHILLLVAQRKPKRLMGDISLLVATAFVLGGFWYIRNWIQMGNPLPPVAIKLAGALLFPGQVTLLGVVPRESSILANILEPGALQLLIDRAWLEKGGIATILAVPVLLLTTLEWGYRVVVHRQHSPAKLILYILLPWGTFFLFMLTPLAAENAPGTLNQLKFGYSPIRYGFSFWALGGLLLARWLSDERWGDRSWPLDAFVVLAIVHSLVTLHPHQLEFSSPPLSRLDLIAWVGLFAGAVVIGCLWRMSPRLIWHWFALALVVILVAGLVLWPAYKASFPARERLYKHTFPGYVKFRRQVREQGAERVNAVGYVNAGFAFSGEGLTTRVLYCRGSIEAWMNCLDSNEVELVAFAQDSQAMAAPLNETAVMQQYAEWFVLILSDEHVHVYRVVP